MDLNDKLSNRKLYTVHIIVGGKEVDKVIGDNEAETMRNAEIRSLVFKDEGEVKFRREVTPYYKPRVYKMHSDPDGGGV